MSPVVLICAPGYLAPASNQRLIKARSSSVVQTLGGHADTVDVVFHDIERHDWATGGVLWSDVAAAPAQLP